MWEPPTQRVTFGPRTRSVPSADSGTRQHGVSWLQRTGTRWPRSSTIRSCCVPEVDRRSDAHAFPGEAAQAAAAA